MKQLNIHITPELEKNIKLLMEKRQLSNKSEAIRLAVREAVNRIIAADIPQQNFYEWLGIGSKTPVNSNPKFKSDDDLWS
jgi:Arc/MetJ-type ribon-helix-helix transcriptional regulator